MSDSKLFWLVVVVGIVLLVWLIQRPRERTKRLVITVWAAVGPYANAEDSAVGLRRAYRAVFGELPTAADAEWLNGHIQNLGEAESARRFQFAQRLMRGTFLLVGYGAAFDKALQRLREVLSEDAKQVLSEIVGEHPELEEKLRPLTGSGGSDEPT